MNMSKPDFVVTTKSIQISAHAQIKANDLSSKHNATF